MNLSLRQAHDRLLEEVAERRLAEQRLRESEELYRFVVELTHEAVWVADGDGRLIQVSRRFFEATGMTNEEALGDSWASAVHPDDLPRIKAGREEARRIGRWEQEFRIRSTGGDYRYVRVRAAPVVGEGGEILRWYGTTEDIHEQKTAVAALRETEERYRLASRATDDIIWDWDLVAGTLQWNDAAAAFFGGPPVQPTPLSAWSQLIHPDDGARVGASLEAWIEGSGERWSERYRLRKRDGEYADILDRGYIIRDDQGAAVRAVGAMLDLTERRLAEAKIQRMQDELIHVSRLSAMGAMASTLAHELNQPLTAVANYVQGSLRLMRGGAAEVPGSVLEALEAAEAGALRAGRIVQRLRELVSRGNVSARTESLPQLIEDAGVLAFVDAPLLGIKHRTELDPQARWVEVDRVQVQQVLINLIRNAVQAMADQPVREIVVSTAAMSARMIEVSVSDTGVGLSPERRKETFSPFQSSKPGGMGIGLSICRTIVEAHGGKIWAEDRKGGGTVFRFTLPRTVEEDQERASPF
jgi:PAS domain S-box-containing protein